MTLHNTHRGYYYYFCLFEKTQFWQGFVLYSNTVLYCTNTVQNSNCVNGLILKYNTCLESILASSLAFLIRLTIHRSASSGDIFNFSANILMLIHWWIRQNVSKINKRAFSMKSSKQAIKKKSFNKT